MESSIIGVQTARAARRGGGIGNCVGRSTDRSWTYSGVVAEFPVLPKGGTPGAWPRCARQGDRGRARVIEYGTRGMAYVRDTVCLSRHESRGLWCNRLRNVWPGCGQENLGCRDALPHARAVGQPISRASLRQQVSIGVASVVPVPLTASSVSQLNLRTIRHGARAADRNSIRSEEMRRQISLRIAQNFADRAAVVVR